MFRFFYGLVPCFRWANTRRKSGHSVWIANQEDLPNRKFGITIENFLCGGLMDTAIL